MKLYENLIDFIRLKSQSSDVFEASSYAHNLQELQVVEWYEIIAKRCIAIKCDGNLFVLYKVDNEFGYDVKFRKVDGVS